MRSSSRALLLSFATASVVAVSIVAAPEQRQMRPPPPGSSVVADAPPLPSTLRGLIEATGLVIVAKVEETSDVTVSPSTRVPRRTHALRVSEVIKGQGVAVGSLIMLEQRGGTGLLDGAVVSTSSAAPILVVGQTGVFFMKAYAGQMLLQWGSASVILVDTSRPVALPKVLKDYRELSRARDTHEVVSALRAVARLGRGANQDPSLR